MIVRFADCTLDMDARRLFRAGRDVHLSPKAFELLNLLIQARPRAIPKSELLERIWPSVFVSDDSLARVVSELRTAIGDRARTTCIIRTVHGYGYAFASETTPPAPARSAVPGRASCWLLSRRRAIPLPDGEHLVSREPGAAVWLDSPKVSRRHARLHVSGSDATLEDLGSKNGTFVRGRRISSSILLHPGDSIRIGPFTFTFRLAPVTTHTSTEVRV